MRASLRNVAIVLTVLSAAALVWLGQHTGKREVADSPITGEIHENIQAEGPPHIRDRMWALMSLVDGLKRQEEHEGLHNLMSRLLKIDDGRAEFVQTAMASVLAAANRYGRDQMIDICSRRNEFETFAELMREYDERDALHDAERDRLIQAFLATLTAEESESVMEYVEDFHVTTRSLRDEEPSIADDRFALQQQLDAVCSQF